MAGKQSSRKHPADAKEAVIAHLGDILAACGSAGVTRPRLCEGIPGRGEDEVTFLVDYDTSKGLLPLLDFAKSLSDILGRPVDVRVESMLAADAATIFKQGAVLLQVPPG